MTRQKLLELQVVTLEAQVDTLQGELHDLNLELTHAYADIERLTDDKPCGHGLGEKVCRSCFVTFTGPIEAQWCSDDCRYFRRARPFEEYYAMLHPKMLQQAGTEPDRALAAKA